jgi:hypothetical protein
MGFVNHFCCDKHLDRLARHTETAVRTAGHRLANAALHVRLGASVETRASSAIASACAELLSWSHGCLSCLSPAWCLIGLNRGLSCGLSGLSLSGPSPCGFKRYFCRDDSLVLCGTQQAKRKEMPRVLVKACDNSHSIAQSDFLRSYRSAYIERRQLTL